MGYHAMAINQNTLTIDGKDVYFEQGQTIMDAALAAKIYIPHLCHYPGLPPSGNCRLCVVETNGKSVAACITQAQAGLRIHSNTPELNAVRKTITQMLFVEGNHICPACEKSGNCKLQAMGYYLGMHEEHFHHFNPRRALDASHPAIFLDRSRCILCDLCVRASREVDGKNVFAIAGRGADAHLIVNTDSGKLGDSNLDRDDLAANICPVGAIMHKQRGYVSPIGQRIYDQQPINEIALGEHVPESTERDHD
ncbi:[NiFe] hydrogenase diaphorase moiety small subunit [Nitrosomonas aestuarii]|uniref:[NiFe] hydrogenase diaphorase moiety small subunit n=2 Tax=Nitrosomonas aestuarii TaxID=52441 RepID=A0A1I3ZS69_9PROT|nr:[NiFe] hydrogenase diaphorase moiety small subunit [Nitrosomonas aestuarii]